MIYQKEATNPTSTHCLLIIVLLLLEDQKFASFLLDPDKIARGRFEVAATGLVPQYLGKTMLCMIYSVYPADHLEYEIDTPGISS